MNEEMNTLPAVGEQITEEQNVLSEEETPKAAEPKKGREFTKKDQVFAWLSFVIGYLFCRFLMFTQQPIFKLIFTVVLFVFALVYFGRRKCARRAWFYPVTALALSLSFFLTDSEGIHAVVFLYVLFAFLLFCLTAGNGALEKYAGRMYGFECLKAICISPFFNIVSIYKAIGRKGGKAGVGKVILWIVIGVGAAIIPTMIIGGLLSYDDNFAEIMRRIRSFVGTEILNSIGPVFFAVPVAMYVFGALSSATDERPCGFTAESCEKTSENVKILPPVAVAAAMIPITVLYVLFIISQRGFYSAVFSGSLPEAYTLSAFARTGFFRLITVAVINAVILTLLRIFTKKSKDRDVSVVVKISSVCLSVLTLILSATALTQMFMYVSSYGLTRKRFIALSFMILLSLVFLVQIVRQFVAKTPFTAVCLALFVLFLGAISLPDTDALIAEYNYDAYTAGSIEQIDVSYLEDLGDSAIPTLIKLSRGTGNAAQEAKRAVGRYGSLIDVRNDAFSLPSLRASHAYEAMSEAEKKECREAFIYPKSSSV